MNTILETTLAWLGQASWQMAVMVALVLLAELVLRERLSVRWRSVLWTLVLVRLCIPVIPASPWSVYNLLPGERIAQEVRSLGTVPERGSQTTIHLGAVDTDPINAIAATPSVATSVPRGMSTMQVMALIWMTGSCFFLAFVLVRSLRLHRAVRRAPQINDSTILSMVHDARQRLGVRREIRVVLHDGVGGPAMTGILRPLLILPSDTRASLTEYELRFVILHEVAHVKRHDVLLNWLMTLVTVLHWFNPLVYLAALRCREHREILCDQMVVDVVGDRNRHDYGAVLLRMVQLVHRPAFPVVTGFVGIFGSRPMIQRRITMLVSERSRPRATTARWIGVLTASVLACATLTDAASNAVEPVSNDPPVADEPLTLPGVEHDPRLLPPATLREARLLPPAIQRDALLLPGAIGDDDKTVVVYDIRDLLPAASTDSPVMNHVYVVKSGDTLASISRRYMGSVDLIDHLLVVNPGLEANRLRVGQTLLVPSERVDTPDESREAQLAKIREIVAVMTERLPEGATIQEMNGNLIVSVGEPGHVAVQSGLNEMRAASLMVDIEAKFVRGLDPVLAALNVDLIEVEDAGGAWSIAMIDREMVDVLLNREVHEVEILSAPRLLVRDGQMATVTVGQPVDLLLPAVADPNELVEVSEFSGLALEVKPVISDDRRSLRLDVAVELSEFDVTLNPVVEASAMLEARLNLLDEGTMLVRLADPQRLRVVAVQEMVDAEGAQDVAVLPIAPGHFRIVTVPAPNVEMNLEPIYLIVQPRILLPHRIEAEIRVDPRDK